VTGTGRAAGNGEERQDRWAPRLAPRDARDRRIFLAAGLAAVLLLGAAVATAVGGGGEAPGEAVPRAGPDRMQEEVAFLERTLRDQRQRVTIDLADTAASVEELAAQTGVDWLRDGLLDVAIHLRDGQVRRAHDRVARLDDALRHP
jgi:hypothetical protein